MDALSFDDQLCGLGVVESYGWKKVGCAEQRVERVSDPRNIKNGWVILDEGYSDQPYVVTTNEGKWLCLMTTGKGVEGEGGRHVVATTSSDYGRHWSELIDIEPATRPEASWVMPLKVPSGRVYAFYTYNKDNIREVPNVASPSIRKRVDTLGAYVFKYSDDYGRTVKRALRDACPCLALDRTNNFDGKTLFFWGVGKPIIHRDAAYFGWAKVGKWGEPGVLVKSQGQVMRSDNILTERDPRKIRWQVLPEGELGLRAPKGPIAEETNLVGMSDGSYMPRTVLSTAITVTPTAAMAGATGRRRNMGLTRRADSASSNRVRRTSSGR